MYRPEECENPYNFMSGEAIPGYELQSKVFDAGANAMLQGIIKEFSTVLGDCNKLTTLNYILTKGVEL